MGVPCKWKNLKFDEGSAYQKRGLELKICVYSAYNFAHTTEITGMKKNNIKMMN